MKVLHVETGMHLYGGALQVLYLIGGLRDRGVHNLLACPLGSRIARETAGVCDKLYALPFTGEADLRFIFRLRNIIRNENPDIVHLHSRRGADVLGGIAAALTGTKTILSRRVDNPEPRFLTRLKYRLYDRVITISNAIREILVSEGVPPNKVSCVHSAVDTGRYSAECDREWFQEEFSLLPQSTAIGMVAQFIRRKGHRHLVEAIPGILKSYPDARFLLFGKGPLEKDIKALCENLNISQNVLFAGFRDDLERILPCLSLLVHPADMEGLGVSLLQAAASGVPIVATEAGGLPEVVTHGITGYLVPPRSPASIADAVGQLLGNPVAAKSMGARGRELVEKNFSIVAMVKGNLNVYNSLLG